MSPIVAHSFMKRDGRTVSRAALEELRVMALQRMREGESPAEVAASFGLHRGWAYKVLTKAKTHSKRALRRPRGRDARGVAIHAQAL